MNDVNRGINIYINEADLTASLNRAQTNAAKLEKQIADISDKTSPKFTALQSKLDGTRAKMAELEGQISGKVNPSLKQMEDSAKKLYNEWRNMAAGTDAANQKLKQFEAVSEAIAHTKEQVKGVSQAMSELKEKSAFTQQFKALFSAEAAFDVLKEGFNKVKEFINDAVKEFKEAQLTVKQLQTGLENTGRGGEVAFKALKTEAEELSSKLKYLDDDTITKVQEKLVTFGKISINQIKAITPVILDYAAKSGKSVDEATLDIIRGLTGQGRALKEYGVELKMGGTAAQNYKVIMEQLASRVKGAADDMSNSFAGSLGQQDAAVKKLSVTIGKLSSGVVTSFALTVANVADNLRHWLGSEEEETSVLEKNKDELESNLIALQDVNLSSEARKKLIDETNSKYKEYLPHLLTEKTSLEEIKNIQIESNKQMMLKIFATSYQKELTEFLKDEADSRMAIVDLQIKQAKLNDDAKKKGLTPAEANQIKGQLKNLENINSDVVNSTGKKTEELNARYKALVANMNSTWEGFQKALDSNVTESNNIMDKHMKDVGTNQDQELQKLNEYLQAYQKIMDDIAAMQGVSNAAKISPEDREQQQLIDKYDGIYKSIRALDKKAADDKLITDEQAAQKDADAKIKIHAAYLVALGVLEDKQFADRSEKEYAAQQKSSAEYYNAEKSKIDDLHAHSLISDEQYAVDSENIASKSAHLQLQNFMDYYDARKAQYKDDAQKTQELENEKLALQKTAYDTDIKNWINAQNRKYAATNTQDATDVTKARSNGNPIDVANAETKQLQDQLNQRLTLITGNADITLDVTRNLEQQRIQIIKDANQKILDDTTLTNEQKQALISLTDANINKEVTNAAVQQQQIEQQKYTAIAGEIQSFGAKATQLLNDVFSFERQADENALAASKQTNDNEKANYKALLDAKKLSQQEYNMDIAASDKNYNAQAAAIKKKQFEQDKASKIITSIINTAVAVTSALSGGPIIGQVLAGITAALGAVETGIIASQPTPQFAKGGVAYGATHSQGGIALVDSASGLKVGEMEHNEPYMILSGNTYSNNKPIVDALLYSSLNRNGAPINIDWLGKTPRFDLGGIYSDMKALRYASGGVFTASAGNDVNIQMLSTLLQLNNTLQAGITSNVVYGNIVDKGNSLTIAQSRASYSQSQ